MRWKKALDNKGFLLSHWPSQHSKFMQHTTALENTCEKKEKMKQRSQFLNNSRVYDGKICYEIFISKAK